jgi:CRP-like cAMP-binding protein
LEVSALARTNGRADVEPLIAKLSSFAALSHNDVRTLNESVGSERRIAAHQSICIEGDAPRAAFVMARGLACRYRSLADGRRQILSYLLPGDLFNINGFLLKAMCYSVVAVTSVTIAPIERTAISRLLAGHPRLSAAIRWCAQQEEAILHERLIALGRQNARARVAFLFCEMVERQRAIGLSEDHSIRLPLTQLDLADTLGLTAVHVNRVLQEMRRENLIRLGGAPDAAQL